MEVKEFEGKNEEEAINKAIESLGLNRDDIDVEGSQVAVQGKRAKSLLEEALGYYHRGWIPIPLRYGTKDKPLIKWTRYRKQRPTKSEVRKWFSGKDPCNIGILMLLSMGNAIIIIESALSIFCIYLQVFASSISA